jgi:hypothetical protein
MRVGHGLALAAALAATGCAADSPLLERMVIVPGYFDTLSCSELATKIRESSARVTELTRLMQKSAEDVSGVVVNALAYNTEYAKARATQHHAELAATSKGCNAATKPEAPVESPDPAQPEE